MKSILLPMLIAVSLIANAALVIKLSLRGDASAAPSTSGAISSLPTRSTPATTTSRASAPNRSLAPGEVPLRWADLPADDLHALVEALRARGFPPEVVRNIIGNRINALQFDQRLALMRSAGPREYWKSRPSSPAGDPAYRAAQRELSQERMRLLTELVGESPPSEASLVSMRNRYGDLSAEKIEQVQLITSDYSDLISQIRNESQGMLLSQDREKLAYLEREQRADLQALLSPAEYEEYMLRSSSTANGMRSQLIGMEPAEQEFRQIFPLQLAFDDEFGTTMRRNTPEWQAQRRAAEQELVAAVKASLGEERGVEFERSRDPTYSQAMQLTQRMQLSKEAAHQTWEIQRNIQQQTMALQSDRTLTPEQRNARLASLAGEARTTLISALGDDIAEAYQQQPAGNWLRNLERRANPPQPLQSAPR